MNQEILDYHVIDFKTLLLLKYKNIGLTDDECHILLLMLVLHDMNQTILPHTIAHYSTLTIEEIDTIMLNLIEKHYIARKRGLLDFKPLYLQLLNVEVKEKEDKNLLQIFENAFGRPLSQIELQFINDFKRSGFDDDTIIEALSEAVKSHVLNFRYIERILDNWKQYGKVLKTEEPVDDEDEDIKNYDWVNR